MPTRRRDVLILGGIVAAVYGLRALPWDRLFGRDLSYRSIDGLAPFRSLETGASMPSRSIALIGLDTPEHPEDASSDRYRDQVAANPCQSLYYGPLSSSSLPIAYFADVQCPICRALERDLDTILSSEGPALQLFRHELPVFGPTSTLAARVILAAERQGLQEEARRRLVQRPVLPGEGAIRAFALEIGADLDLLVRDMNSTSVTARLARSESLADLFGFVGTPALVIGRTSILGAAPLSTLRQVIADERALPPLSC